jgi:Glycosyltransferase family 87
VPPAGYQLSGKQALAIARRNTKVVRVQREAGPLAARPYLLGSNDFLIRFYRGSRLRVQVDVSGRDGRVRWADAGREIGWPSVAHGHHGARSRRLHWILGLAGLLFVLPFFDPRRPLRLLHLDLLMIAALAVSFGFAEAGRVYVSTPLMYPPLLYLLGRALWLALSGRASPPARLTWAGPQLLARALALLLVLRLGWVLADGVVRDIGYASVYGADSIINGFPVYNELPNDPHLDAYGPLMYLAYVPFTLAIPLKGLASANAHAATAAALTFDLGTITCLYLIGTRLREGLAGRHLGLCLAWAYAACPWSLLVIADAPNDGLIALLLALVLLVWTRPGWRGLVLGLAVAAKFAPAALVPLFARVGRERGRRALLLYAVAVAATVALLVVLYLPGGSFRIFWDQTIKFQATRTAPFSMWGLHPAWEPVKWVVGGLAAALALAAFWLPRERSLERLAAAGAALLIAVELTATYWYWYYVVWFLPYLLVALFSRSYAGSVRNSGSSSASAVATNSS